MGFTSLYFLWASYRPTLLPISYKCFAQFWGKLYKGACHIYVGDGSLSLFVQHSLEWLSLVGPAVAFVVVVTWVLRRWLSLSVWHYLAAWFGGLMAIAALSFVVVYFFAGWLDRKLGACNAGPDYYLCTDNIHIVAYPVIIGLIAFCLYFVMTLGWGIFRLVRGKKAV